MEGANLALFAVIRPIRLIGLIYTFRSAIHRQPPDVLIIPTQPTGDKKEKLEKWRNPYQTKNSCLTLNLKLANEVGTFGREKPDKEEQ